ncbi:MULTISPECIES: hypothetical protein [Lelliottia]|uniref:Fimbrial protein n=1 Tax=Lelliottia aquatilis TaxID=2080838 RepID=A0ABX4ZXC4_9ENTR|nr:MULTISPECIES: hypothetical protein [Lelliottia]POZ16192.1 hypothetical protein C3Z09_12625 [Lelliottia aquatilis]POZ16223.1 hypothetical protein C3708_20080 [Lelliottia sp. 7254-16]POZ20537.1 hypothetical protein C3712_18145 [Lelliottia aquatilis]POZ22044.1 hypothetical protein C3711_18890 [Lelliottia aquatilis]POZ33110.1 hypothetical protein C3710_10200 [Lelliottia aquatilis]
MVALLKTLRHGPGVIALLVSCLGCEHAGAAIYAVKETPLTLTTTRISKLELHWLPEKETFTTATLTTRLKLGELTIDVDVGGAPVPGGDVAVRLSSANQGSGPGQGYMFTDDDDADGQQLSVTLAGGSEGSPLKCGIPPGLCQLSGEAQERHTVSLWADSGQSAAEGIYTAMIDVQIYT